MTIGGVYSPASWAVEQARINVADPTRLRDYFRRLGASAEIDGSTVVVALSDEQAHETGIDEYLRAWMDVNGAVATIEPEAAEAAPPVEAIAPSTDAFITNAPPVHARPRLGDLLLARGLITSEQLTESLIESRATNQLLGSVLIGRGHIFEDELARSLATQLDLPYVSLRSAGVDRGVARMLPAFEGMRLGAIPIGYFGGRVRVAFADPVDEEALEVVQRYIGTFATAVAELSDIRTAWRTVGQAGS